MCRYEQTSLWYYCNVSHLIQYYDEKKHCALQDGDFCGAGGSTKRTLNPTESIKILSGLPLLSRFTGKVFVMNLQLMSDMIAGSYFLIILLSYTSTPSCFSPLRSFSENISTTESCCVKLFNHKSASPLFFTVCCFHDTLLQEYNVHHLE